MEQTNTPTLTPRQYEWLEHIQACEASEKSIATYAVAQGFSAQAMYAAKKLLVKKGFLPATRKNRFQRVQIADNTFKSQWQIQLPNGVSVAFSGAVDSGTLSAVLSTAAALA